MEHVRLFEDFKSDLTFYTDGKLHLVCKPYSVENLHRMAAILQIKRGWYHGGDKPHYDVPVKRKAEIEAQCVIVSPKEILRIIQGL